MSERCSRGQRRFESKCIDKFTYDQYMYSEWLTLDTKIQERAYRDITGKKLPEAVDWSAGLGGLNYNTKMRVIKRGINYEKVS
jgi:hypothetical protein